MISIVNYGLGNVQAIANIYKQLNVACRTVSTADELRTADRIILPGVGSFDWAMERLEESGMRDVLDQLVQVDRKPVLGICVGMQMMAQTSEEGVREGLGWFDAQVRRFRWESPGDQMLLPHMGWNDVQPQGDSRLYSGLETGARFYFLHSYFVAPVNVEDVLAVTDYRGAFASSIHAGNVYGVQFHPEKSHHWGIQLLRNFAELQAC